MGTPYLAIYTRAITELKDPHIKALFNNDEVLFNQVMYNFLENAISLFTNPIKVVGRLQKKKDPYILYSSFTGDGVTGEFGLNEKPDSPSDLNNFVYKFIVNNQLVNGDYEYMSNTVKLDNIPPLDSSIELFVYYTGEFELDLFEQEIYVLSQLLVSCWSEYVANDKLDITRLLGDTDFKLTSNAATTTAKVGWNIVNRETAIKRMNKFAWDAQMMRLYR